MKPELGLPQRGTGGGEKNLLPTKNLCFKPAKDSINYVNLKPAVAPYSHIHKAPPLEVLSDGKSFDR